MTDSGTLDAVEDRLRRLLGAKRYDDAEAVAREGLAGCPDSVLLHRLLSDCLAGQERYEEALAEAEAACGLDPHDPTAARNLSYRRAECGDRSGAVAAARRGIDLAPHAWTSHYTLASALLDEAHLHDREALHEALDAVEEALRIAPTEASALHLRGMVLARLGRTDEGRASYEQALGQDPHHVGALTGLARLDIDRKPRLAAERFTAAAALDPQSRAMRDNAVAMQGNLAVLFVYSPAGIGMIVAVVRVLGAPLWLCALSTVLLLGLFAGAWWGMAEYLPRGLGHSPAAVWRVLSPRQRRSVTRAVVIGVASLAFGLAPVPVPLTVVVLVVVLVRAVVVRRRLAARSRAARGG